MSKTKNTILLSSFEAFAGRPQNRSQLLAEKILQLWPLQEDIHLEHVVLPVVFEKAAEQLQDTYKKIDARVLTVISLGECPDKEIRFEQRAENAQHSPLLADNNGKLIEQKTPIFKGYPDFVCLNSSCLEKAKELKLHSPWKASESVGLYVCNDLAFRSQIYFASKKIRYSFIHVPHLDVDGASKTEDMAEDLVKLLKQMSASAFD